MLSLLACSTQEAPVETPPEQARVEAPSPAPNAQTFDATQPTADQVLQRFIDATNQCRILTAENYRIVWKSIVTDQKSLAIQEKVMHQGRQGVSFTKIHEQSVPAWGITALGRTADGKYWSGTNAGIQPNIVDPGLQGQIMQNLDPTPACAYDKRWNERLVLGSATYQDKDCWHLKLGWADGTVSEAWFDKEEGLLRGMVTRNGTYELAQDMGTYTEVSGIYWPSQEKGREERDGNVLIMARKLVSLHIDEPTPDIGPAELSKMLQQKISEGKLKVGEVPAQGG